MTQKTAKAIVREADGTCHPTTIWYDQTGAPTLHDTLRPTGQTAELRGWGLLDGTATELRADGAAWVVLLPQLSTAEQISRELGDDGQIFETADGVSLDELCCDCDGVPTRNDQRDATRYVFADGSVITVAGDGWDLGYPGCHCWQGAGHDSTCSLCGESW